MPATVAPMALVVPDWSPAIAIRCASSRASAPCSTIQRTTAHSYDDNVIAFTELVGTAAT
jgi:hypothetical protein